MSDANPAAVIVGATNIDTEARVEQSLRYGASNPAALRQQLGGVAANVCRACMTLTPTVLVTALGDQASSQFLKDSITDCGIDARLLPSEGEAGQYLAVLDPDNQLILGLSDTQALETVTSEDLLHNMSGWPEYNYLAFDTNLPETLIATLLHNAAHKKTIALAVSPRKSLRLKGFAKRIDLLIGNRAEFAALSETNADGANACELAMSVKSLGFGSVVMSDAAMPVQVITEKACKSLETPVLSRKIRSVNGAGDAMAGGIIGGLCDGRSLVESLRECGFPAARSVLTESL